jgi:hypothetical protein
LLFKPAAALNPACGVEAGGEAPNLLYETTPKWHGFFFDLTGLFFAGGWVGFEYRTRNIE